MGIYVNPGNEAFKQMIDSEIYVDKSGILIALNRFIGTEQKFICCSRARRFGKSVTAGMLKAYYSKGCDSENLFLGLEIAKNKNFRKHLNKYNVIHVDMASMWVNCGKAADEFLPFLNQRIFTELKEEYANVDISAHDTLAITLAEINKATGSRFVVIIDEWDTVFREARQNKKLQENYITMLRGLFKSDEAKSFIALGYITGILPVKKYGIESALNNFIEFTMVSPKIFAKYYGFTEEEVKTLCAEYDVDFDKICQWYDGYVFNKTIHIYNPNSVVCALRFGSIESYWSNTEAFSSLKSYICMDFEGLRDDIMRMFAGGRCIVRVKSFANDFVSYKSKDDVMTALIHLGYLAYDAELEEAFIPNAEVEEAFRYAIQEAEWHEVTDAIRASRSLLQSTWQMNAAVVAEAIDKVHMQSESIFSYNDENSLSCVLNLAYYGAKDFYNVIREMPTGKGYADFVFVPKKNRNVPAIIMELKYGKSPEDALAQIRERNYMAGLPDYQNNMLLVGINYDKETKKHTCMIEPV